MSNDLVSLLLDVVILIFLGATIVFVYRLTRGLEDFKRHRREFDSVIANLLASIDQADHSVRTLKKVSAEEAGRLENSVSQANALCEELRIITEAGESMAKRLEKLAETNRKIVQPSQGAIFSRKPKERDDAYGTRSGRDEASDKISSPVHRDKEGTKKSKSYGSTLKQVKKDDEQNQQDLPSFMIKDTEYEGSDTTEGSSPVPKKLRSQAEQELLDALRTTRKNISDK